MIIDNKIILCVNDIILFHPSFLVYVIQTSLRLFYRNYTVKFNDNNPQCIFILLLIPWEFLFIWTTALFLPQHRAPGIHCDGFCVMWPMELLAYFTPCLWNSHDCVWMHQQVLTSWNTARTCWEYKTLLWQFSGLYIFFNKIKYLNIYNEKIYY